MKRWTSCLLAIMLMCAMTAAMADDWTLIPGELTRDLPITVIAPRPPLAGTSRNVSR